MKRVFSAIFAIILICLTVTPAFAIDYGCDVVPECDAVYVEELNTGTVVYEYYADEEYRNRIYPASTTKILTFIVVAENVPDLSTKVEITEEALADLDPESSVMGLTSHIGESFTVRDLLYGLMLPSGNDAALVLANYVGGSEAGFVDMMNRKAAQIGCADTHFTSPHGLHDSQHYTTVRDMAKIAKYALKLKQVDFLEICNTVSYQPEGFSSAFRTTNYLIDESAEGGKYGDRYYYPYAKGIKTGYTDEAGKCLISTAEKDGYRYLCIAMGADYSYAEDINYAMLDSKELYQWMFDNIAYGTVYDSSDVYKSIPVEYVWGNKMLDLVPEKPVTALLPKDYDPKLVVPSDDIASYATAPVKKGDTFGTLTITYDGEVIGTTRLVAAEDVDKHVTNAIAVGIVGFVRTHVVLSIFLLLAFIVALVFLIRALRRRKARRSRRSRSRIRRD